MYSWIKLLPLLILQTILVCEVHAQSRYTGQSIQEILNLPEEDIDLGLAMLVLAKEAWPNMNVERFDNALDIMAQQVNYLLQGVEDPEARIGMMNTYLYKPGWWNDSLTFSYDIDDLEGQKKENQFINGYLSTRRGSCITMPMLWIVLADRLDWPVHAVHSTKHYFLRYEDPSLEYRNIEATTWGGYVPDEDYRADSNIPDFAIENGVYLRSLSKKEYIASLLNNQATHHYNRENDINQAVEYLELAVSFDSTLAMGWWNAGVLYQYKARQLEEELDSRIRFMTASLHMEMARQVSKQTMPTPAPRPSGNFPNTPSFPVPQPSLMGSTQGIASVFPGQIVNNHPQLVGIRQNNTPNASYQAASPTGQLIIILQEILRDDISNLQEQYYTQINLLMERSVSYREKAKALGIVFEFTEEFLRKHLESVELQRLQEQQIQRY